jgi:hypothetical protein
MNRKILAQKSYTRVEAMNTIVVYGCTLSQWLMRSLKRSVYPDASSEEISDSSDCEVLQSCDGITVRVYEPL